MRQHAVSRLLDPASVSRHRDAIELMLLHRRSPLEPQVRQLRDSGVLAVVPAAPQDRAGVLEIVSRAEGPEAARVLGRWIDAQPAGLYVARSETGVEAFALHILVSPEDNPVPDDPVVRAVLDAIDRRSPLRPGERIGIGRGLGNRGDYERAVLAVLAGSVSSIVEWLSRPVAWSVITPLHEDFWRPFFEYLGFGVLARVRFGAGDVTAYGWDRRRLPVAEFLELTGRRELTGETGPPPPELLRPAPLGRDAFDEAVRAALRDVNRPDRLAAGPLAGTALAPGLREALVAGIAALGDEPKGELLRPVLERTYLHGAPSQEAAAEVLGLPFSTYRRHLARATTRLVDLLWAVEVGRE
jgi:hypothetical protein